MLFNATRFFGSEIQARDGRIGKVTDIYFDDKTWNVRYIVVTCEGWFDRREIILIPSSIRMPSTNTQMLMTDLTMEQVKNSPKVSSDLPVSRQYETELHEYYAWTPYWTYPIYGNYGFSSYYPNVEKTASALKQQPGSEHANETYYDSHLRSLKGIKGYHIRAVDDELGHIEDLVIDSEIAEVTHFVVDTVNWWPSKHVLIEVSSVRSIDWESRTLSTFLDRGTIKAAPEFDATRTLEPEAMEALWNYYHRQNKPWIPQGEFRDMSTHPQ